ncbi:hypothetical protein O7635_07420 [Asanoa sp. WMMD1127]|uniref:hypothetical protein n=1 Tax=Asanoa sp. WMMD1127 TaxID=3016107 RepID=UPI0024169E35|nr:hypothetical protein [Asanoa sp. WMMD1127]MDG4821681.1 hypothetical protein [Asanoa sp. WMMD1127]
MFFGKRPDPAQIEVWNRAYLTHGRDERDPQACAATGCPGRFPCAARLEAAELLIVAGVGVPTEVLLPTPRRDADTPGWHDWDTGEWAWIPAQRAVAAA